MSQPALPPLELAAAHEDNPNVGAVNNPGIIELPHGWFQFINPSGYVYYFHSQARLHTRLDPRAPGASERLLLNANQLIQELPPEAAAVHIQISILSIREDVVYYYMIDHGARRIFWTHEAAGADLGINHPHDQEYLRTLPSPFVSVLTETLTLVDEASRLLPHYWAHVEQYPEGTPDDVPAEEGLVGTLLLSRIPGYHHLTPFLPERCEELIVALDTVRAINGGGYRKAYVGRLWRMITTHQHWIRYGPLARGTRARLRGPVDLVGRRQLVEFGVLDWLGQFAPRFIHDLSISEVCLFVYSTLLVGVIQQSSGGRLFQGRLFSMGFAASLIALPLGILYPGIQGFVEAIGFEAGQRNQLKGLLILGLLSFDLGVYLALLNLLPSTLASSESLPSMTSLLSVLLALTLPLVFGVLRFIDQRVPGD
ncbi:hypothetical protein FRC04_006647 [Tulasnella sp. 424]|nr:hypothetical protein FRC04_006647 [Tulasnella sp. 424]KAG8975323.1 hypothetical protein FRC05_005882 [Tulasnella sp. 425]